MGKINEVDQMNEVKAQKSQDKIQKSEDKDQKNESEKQVSVGKYISIINRYMNSILDKELQKYDIDRGQFPFLIPLYHKEGISQKELCSFYNMDKAAAVRALNKLEKKGYVKRMKDPDDKRQHQVFLTEKARGFGPKLDEIICKTENTLLKGLEEKEREELSRILSKISSTTGIKTTL